MQVSVEKLSPVLVEFQIEVPADRVKQEIDRAYQTLQRTARVRGFRPGKAPRDVLAHVFGDRVAMDVTQRLVDATLPQALNDKNVQPLSQPAIEPQKLESNRSFHYKARFEVRPEIEKVDYEGLEAKRPSTEVTDAMVEEELEAIRKAHATLVQPEPARPAKSGDVVTMSFTVEIDGKVVEDAGAKDFQVEIGTGQLLSGLEEGLDGMAVGEKKAISLTLPATHPREDFRNKPAVFHVEVTDIKERQLPALDDELAKDVGDFETLAALKDDIRSRLAKDLERKAADSVAEQLVIGLCQKNPIPVPSSLVEQQCKVTESEMVQAARRQGRTLRVDEQLHAQIHADAEVKVRAGLLMAEIAKLEQVQVTDDDLEKGYAELAEQTGKQVARIKAEYREPQRRDILVAMILEDKILDIIESKAKITDE